MPANKLKIGLIQTKAHSEPNLNLLKQNEEIRNATKNGAQVIVLQELFSTLYFCDIEDEKRFELAEKIPGKVTDYFSVIAKELCVVLVLSLFEERAPGLYHNTAVVIDADGSYLGKYRKMHIPDDPGYYEKFYFTPGDLGYKSFKTMYGNIGVLICWDQWFPEAARLTAMKGADLLVYPTAIGWADGESKEVNQQQRNAWTIIQQSHAIANGIPVVSVNRVGKEGAQTFWGSSFVCNAQGHILRQFSSVNEETEVITIDLNHKNQIRKTWPYFRDRRVDSYSDIQKLWSDENDKP